MGRCQSVTRTAKKRWVRRALSLIEVLIVVVIMAILAAVVIPQFASSTEDARASALQFNLHTLRSQIELYKAQHFGRPPQLTNNDLPQLTSATNAQGEIGPPGPNYPYGPYIQQALPPNPYDGKNRVVAVANPGQVPTAPADAGGGWQYDPTTGAIYPNNPEFFRSR
ncbi:MAG: type II secretion system GspH family protein [Thermoguttaceae bacterium]|nr:type II secretion system GspH family protein [Thermoguttaceae bacterium]MDW8079247.1 type II secretion system protein [Thermoguttaceae bacterium]